MQLGQLQKAYGEFEKRGVDVVALSQEDRSVEAAGGMAKKFADGTKFGLLADVDRKITTFLDRTTAYLIDEKGVVVQVFPMVIHVRPSWGAFLSEIDRWREKKEAGRSDGR